jgi:hypothetical protein
MRRRVGLTTGTEISPHWTVAINDSQYTLNEHLQNNAPWILHVSQLRQKMDRRLPVASRARQFVSSPLTRSPENGTAISAD